jgi:HD-like signal output (HDOD) protein
MLKSLRDVVSRGDFTVPPYPAIALRLQRLLAQNGYGVSEVADVIAADAALAASVLAAANSGLFGAGSPITSLSRAVNRLGARTVGSIAIASGVGSVATAKGLLLDVKFRVWRRTMTCALACRKLADGRGLAPEEAFLAGLLHGFGRSIAVTSIEDLLKTAKAHQPLTVEEWLSIAEQHRAALARAVARSWKLPQVIADAIDSKQRGASALNDLVLDADAIAGELEAGGSPEASVPTEARSLAEFIANLPAALEAFSSPTAAAAKRPNPPNPVVAKPEHALVGELRSQTLAVVDRGAKGPASLTCMSLAPAGIEIDSSRPYQEGAIVRLLVGDPKAGLEPWLTVVLCVPRGSRYRVELQLFSPTPEVRERWRKRYDAAAPDPSAPPQESPALQRPPWRHGGAKE